MESEIVSRGRLAIEPGRNLKHTKRITYFSAGIDYNPRALIREIQISSARSPENFPEGFEPKIRTQESLNPQP
jgi:hypothetical protein